MALIYPIRSARRIEDGRALGAGEWENAEKFLIAGLDFGSDPGFGLGGRNGIREVGKVD